MKAPAFIVLAGMTKAGAVVYADSTTGIENNSSNLFSFQPNNSRIRIPLRS